MTAGSVKGSAGRGELHGRGPLIVNDPRYPEVNGLGLVHNSGRVDSFAWDPQGERLFAAVASGGVWRWDDLAKTWQSATGKPAHLGHRCGGVDAGGRRQAPDADR